MTPGIMDSGLFRTQNDVQKVSAITRVDCTAFFVELLALTTVEQQYVIMITLKTLPVVLPSLSEQIFCGFQKLVRFLIKSACK